MLGKQSEAGEIFQIKLTKKGQKQMSHLISYSLPCWRGKEFHKDNARLTNKFRTHMINLPMKGTQQWKRVLVGWLAFDTRSHIFYTRLKLTMPRMTLSLCLSHHLPSKC